MGFLDRFRRNKAVGSSSAFTWMSQGDSPRRGSAELIGLYNTSPSLRRVVHRLASTVGSTQWQLYRKGRAGSKDSNRYAPLKHRTKALGSRSNPKEEGYQQLDEHPILSLLTKPNPEMHGQAAIGLLQTYLEIKGEAFIVVERGQTGGLPAQLWVIPPTWVNTTPTPEIPFFNVTFGRLSRQVPKEDVIWLRDANPSDPYGRGTGFGDSLADELDTDEFASKYLKGFFKNRAKPDVIIGVENVKNSEQLKEAKNQFNDQNRGIQRGHQVHFTSGKLNIHEFGKSFKDLEMTQLRAFEQDVVRQTFGVSPELFGELESSNRATIQNALRIFSILCIVPRLERLRLDLQHALVDMFDPSLVLHYVNPVPEDREFELDALKARPETATVNEWRAFQGLPSLEERGEVFMVQLANVAVRDFEEMSPEMLLSMRMGVGEPPVKAVQDSRIEKAHRMFKAQDALVEKLLSYLRADRMTKELDPVWKAQVDEWGNDVLNDIGVSPAFDMQNPGVKDFLEEQSSTRVTMVTEATKDRLRSTLTEGVRAGEDTADLAKRVEREMSGEISRWRAVNIARTETNRAANFATLNAQVQSGVVEQRQWVDTPDESTRDEHLALGGQVVGVNDPFVYGTMTAMYPGDFGTPEMDCQCRCTTVPIITEPDQQFYDELDQLVQEELPGGTAGEEASTRQLYTKEAGWTKAARDAIWKRMDRKLVPWDAKAERAVRRAMRRQQEDLLAKMPDLFG